MPPRLTKRNYKPVEIPVLTAVQEKFGLSKGDDVRFRINDVDGATWSAARVTGENKDGSLALYEIKTGHSRCIMPEKVQRKTLGPRGGTVWEDLVPA